MARISSEEALLDAALLSPEIAPFAMFNIEIPPQKDGWTGLWRITSNEGSARSQRSEDFNAAIHPHKMRVEEMVNRVEHGLSPFEEEDAPQPDEWEHFWGGASPTEGHYLPDSAFAPKRRPHNKGGDVLNPHDEKGK